VTSDRWEAAGRPEPGSRPGEGEAIATGPSGNPVVRYSSALSLENTTGDIEALSLWAGQSVALAKRVQPAAEIVDELVSRI
jgi:NAD(P)H-dependent flavin oxidoreductase YrpB (nitropropane dioxygenase family)